MLETAIILAGGFGTRLQSVVANLPKPMASVNHEPFLNYQFKYLKNYGIKKVVLSVGYLSDKIKEYYGSLFNGLEISYAIETTPLGTGGGIRLAIEKCLDEQVFVLNGDSFFDVNLRRFYALHTENKSQISLALRKVNDASRYGTIETNDYRVISFKEKTNISKPGTINGGIYILDKNLYLTNTSEGENFSIEIDFFEKQLNKLLIKGFDFEEYFLDIGIPEDYAKAQHDFKEFKYR